MRRASPLSAVATVAGAAGLGAAHEPSVGAFLALAVAVWWAAAGGTELAKARIVELALAMCAGAAVWTGGFSASADK